jgi:hypothetical protein
MRRLRPFGEQIIPYFIVKASHTAVAGIGYFPRRSA